MFKSRTFEFEVEYLVRGEDEWVEEMIEVEAITHNVALAGIEKELEEVAGAKIEDYRILVDFAVEW